MSFSKVWLLISLAPVAIPLLIEWNITTMTMVPGGELVELHFSFRYSQSS